MLYVHPRRDVMNNNKKFLGKLNTAVQKVIKDERVIMGAKFDGQVGETVNASKGTMASRDLDIETGRGDYFTVGPDMIW